MTQGKIDEKSVKTPDNFHGIMHLTRELILSSKFKIYFAMSDLL